MKIKRTLPANKPHGIGYVARAQGIIDAFPANEYPRRVRRRVARNTHLTTMRADHARNFALMAKECLRHGMLPHKACHPAEVGLINVPMSVLVANYERAGEVYADGRDSRHKLAYNALRSMQDMGWIWIVKYAVRPRGRRGGFCTTRQLTPAFYHFFGLQHLFRCRPIPKHISLDAAMDMHAEWSAKQRANRQEAFRRAREKRAAQTELIGSGNAHR